MKSQAYIKKYDQELTAKIIKWITEDLPKKVEEIANKYKRTVHTGKRTPDDLENGKDDKMPLNQRITQRKDIPNKKIKTDSKPDEKEESKPEEGERKEKMKKDTKKTRCNFWPKCNKPDCPFAHPKDPCPKFPFCKFGTKCIYVHPVVSIFPVH